MPRPARQLLQRRQQALADTESPAGGIDEHGVHFLLVHVQHGVAGNGPVLHGDDAVPGGQHGRIRCRHGRSRPDNNLLRRIVRGAADAHGHRAQGPQGVDVGGQGGAQGDGHGGFRGKSSC